jgi:hypothetical protein
LRFDADWYDLFNRDLKVIPRPGRSWRYFVEQLSVNLAGDVYDRALLDDHKPLQDYGAPFVQADAAAGLRIPRHLDHWVRRRIIPAGGDAVRNKWSFLSGGVNRRDEERPGRVLHNAIAIGHLRPDDHAILESAPSHESSGPRATQF